MARSVSAESPLALAMSPTNSSVHLHQLYCDLFVICYECLISLRERQQKQCPVRLHGIVTESKERGPLEG